MGEARQQTAQHVSDVTEEQRADRAFVMLWVTAADGQHAMQAQMVEAGDGGRADFLALLGTEQERQLMLTQRATDDLLADQAPMAF